MSSEQGKKKIKNRKALQLFIQTPLKEQWTESKTTKSLSLQTACYVILDFGKYYVSEQLRTPRSFIFIRFFCFFLSEKSFFRGTGHFLCPLGCLWLLFVLAGHFVSKRYCQGYMIFPLESLRISLSCQFGSSSNTCNIYAYMSWNLRTVFSEDLITSVSIMSSIKPEAAAESDRIRFVISKTADVWTRHINILQEIELFTMFYLDCKRKNTAYRKKWKLLNTCRWSANHILHCESIKQAKNDCSAGAVFVLQTLVASLKLNLLSLLFWTGASPAGPCQNRSCDQTQWLNSELCT